MDRILRSTPGVIRMEFHDATGALVDADGGTDVLVTIVDGAGAAVVTAGVAAQDDEGIYSYTLTPDKTALLDRYKATWTATIGAGVQLRTGYYEVVGGFLFSVAEARNYDRGLAAEAVSDADIIEKRQVVEERFEKNLSTALVPRGARIRVDGIGSPLINLRHPETGEPVSRIRSVTGISIGTTPMTQGELDEVAVYAEAGRLASRAKAFSFGFRNVAVWFEYGYDQPPAPLREVGLVYLRALVVPRNEDERVLSTTNELGTVRLAQPSLRYPTGIPRVDSVLAEYCDHVGGIA